MKKVGAIFFVFVMALLLCSSAQAQPIAGTYDSRTPDFNAGTWTEILSGGAEGAPGNQILSGATEYYRFEGAILDDVILLGEPTADQPFYEYRTVYKGGTLTLYNNPDADPMAGWYNEEDDELEYVVNLKNTIVVTKKYVDAGVPTGEIEFALFVVDARFKDCHGYTVCVTAKFDKDEPIPVENSNPPAYGGTLTWAIISIKEPEYVKMVPVDIKPGSCPNPVNVVSKGVLPVAILGTADFDVTQIDPSSIRLNGVAPLRYSFEDVSQPYEPCTGKWDAYACNECCGDGYMDMSLKFDTQEFVASLGEVEDREPVVVHLTGCLKEEYGKTPIKGEDVIVILAKAKTHGMSTVIGNIMNLIKGQGKK